MHVGVLAFKILNHCSHENIDIYNKVTNFLQNILFFVIYFSALKSTFIVGQKDLQSFIKYLETNQQNWVK